MTHPSKRKQPERKFVVQAVEYLERVLPKDSYITVIPGGGKGQRKKIGYRNGTPDVLCLIPMRGDSSDYCQPILFEAKAKRKYATAEQREAHNALHKACSYVAVVRTISDIEHFLCLCEVPLRARIAA